MKFIIDLDIKYLKQERVLEALSKSSIDLLVNDFHFIIKIQDASIYQDKTMTKDDFKEYLLHANHGYLYGHNSPLHVVATATTISVMENGIQWYKEMRDELNIHFAREIDKVLNED